MVLFLLGLLVLCAAQDDVTEDDLPSLEERLFETTYALQIFKWQYILLVLLLFGILYVAKLLYALPFFLSRRGQKDESESNQTLLTGVGGALGPDMTHVYKSRQGGGLDSELTTNDNKAVATAFTGYYIGIGFVVSGSYQDFDDDPVLAIMYVVVFTTFGLVFLVIAQIINDRVILFRYRNSDAIKNEENLAIAIVEASGFVASGQIIGASLSGGTNGWAEDIASCVLFFFAGQVGLVLYSIVYQVVTEYDDQQEVGKGNIAAGLNMGLNLISCGVLLANPVSKSDSIVAFFLWFAVGVIILVVMRFIVDKIILRGRPLDKEISEDQNYGAALIQGSISITIVQLINTFLRDETCGAIAAAAE